MVNKFSALKVDILSIDVGAKTQDILIYNGFYENCFKFVLPSASYRSFHTVIKYTRKKKNLIITGEVMGGGPFKIALYEHIKTVKQGVPCYNEICPKCGAKMMRE